MSGGGGCVFGRVDLLWFGGVDGMAFYCCFCWVVLVWGGNKRTCWLGLLWFGWEAVIIWLSVCLVEGFFD
jgi:uncharacterized membrane-anchored protein